jgi:hypothetical protein
MEAMDVLKYERYELAVIFNGYKKGILTGWD